MVEGEEARGSIKLSSSTDRRLDTVVEQGGDQNRVSSIRRLHTGALSVLVMVEVVITELASKRAPFWVRAASWVTVDSWRECFHLEE